VNFNKLRNEAVKNLEVEALLEAGQTDDITS
jgi:hypothetical protein